MIKSTTKLLLSLSLTLLSFSALALEKQIENILTASEQMDIISNIAKSIRRDHWTNGYKDVSSEHFFVSKDFLKEHLSKDHESNLDSDEIAQLYKCYNGKTCELYFVGVSSSIYGGYGSEAYFILLYPKSGKHFKISHVEYAE